MRSYSSLCRVKISILVAIIISVSFVACTDENKSSQSSSSTVRGFSLSPQGFPLDYSQITAFFDEVKTFGRISVMWNGAWRDDAVNGSDAGTVPAAATAIAQNAETYNYTPVAVFGWRSGSTLYIKVPANLTNDWSNSNAITAFATMLTTYASTHHPTYVFLGNESDFYYEQDATDYARWITAYNTLYDAVKAASSNTRVGPVFNVEHMSGAGALTGWTTPFWSAIDSHDFSKIDIVGLTLYPWFQFSTASSVPSNYLDTVISHLNGKPFAITETGWPAENLGGLNPAWETSETAQQTYVARLASMVAGKNVAFVNWLFLYDMVDPGGSPTEWKLFGSVSLRQTDGTKRLSYSSWASF